VKVNFYEIDNDGRGPNTWTSQRDNGMFLKEYQTEGEMLEDAALFTKMGISIRFHTQQEYWLHNLVDTILENDD
jgi:hypothetical protein